MQRLGAARSGGFGFFLAAALTAKPGNQLAAMHSEGVAFDWAPFVVPVPTQRLVRLLRLLKT